MSNRGLGYGGMPSQQQPKGTSGPDMLIRQLTGGAVQSFSQMAEFGDEIGKMMQGFQQALSRIELTQQELVMQLAGINQRLGELVRRFTSE